MVPVAAKVGALLAVAAAGSTSVWYFSDSIFGTSVVSVAEETGTNYGDNSIGKKYGKYFLSSKTNKKIWENKYKDNEKKFSTGDQDNKAKDRFSTVASAFSKEEETSNTTSLNKICDAAYKEVTSGNLVDTEPTSSSTTQFFKTNVWEFCGLGKIVALDKDGGNYPADSSGASTIGGDETNKKLFVSTKAKDNVNDWFWKLKTEEFWSGTPAIKGTSNTDNVFKKLFTNQAEKDKKTNIKNACEEAYKKTTTEDNDKKNKEDALVFCSIKLELSSDA